MIGNAVSDLGNSALDFLARLGQIALVAVIYFAIAYIIIRVVVGRLRNSAVLARYGKNGSLIAFRLISIFVYIVATVGVLSYAGVNTSGILTLISAFTVAIGLALQDVMRNLISGLFMLAEKPFSVGDRVRVRDRIGTVQGIDIRTTMMRTDEGELLMVPNQLMFTEILQNNSLYNMRLVKYRITTPLPLAEIVNTLERTVAEIESVRPPVDPPILVQHTEDGTEWEVHFSVSARQMARDHEIGEALLAGFPEAAITRVEA